MRSIILFFSILCFNLTTIVLIHAESATPTDPAESAYYKKVTEAATEIKNENYQKAQSLIDEIEKLKPNSVESQSLRGNLYTKQKDYAKAMEIFVKIAEQNPDNIGAEYNVIEIEFTQKKYISAREKFMKILDKVNAVPKDQPNKLPFGPFTAEFIKYKIYLTYVFNNDLTEAKKQLDQFDPYSESPIYYFGCAAMEFANKNNVKGLEWIGSAAKIYNPLLIQYYCDSLFDKGWIRKGEKPGDITADLSPTDQK